MCIAVLMCVCVRERGRQGHVAVLNTTAVSGSERSAFASVVGQMKPYSLFIKGQAVIHTHGPVMRTSSHFLTWRCAAMVSEYHRC